MRSMHYVLSYRTYVSLCTVTLPWSIFHFWDLVELYIQRWPRVLDNCNETILQQETIYIYSSTMEQMRRVFSPR